MTEADSKKTRVTWDPDRMPKCAPSKEAVLRIASDVQELYRDPAPGICVVQDEQDITKVHALITGPMDTPYEGGFFYFLVRFPTDYPSSCPCVKIMTTSGNTVRFNPNLYKNGKVCLSILGTWSGPGWSPVLSLTSVLVSIQSLLNEKPYCNEPGYEQERQPGDICKYNDIIRHETLRVAVCEMLEDNALTATIPSPLRTLMEESFLSMYELYELTCMENEGMDGRVMTDPFGETRGKFQYRQIIERLQQLKEKLDSQKAKGGCHS